MTACKELLASNPDALHELLKNVVDFPLTSANDEKSGNRPFLLCEFNRHGKSHRSPFSNTFHPPLESSEESSLEQLPDDLRKLEIQINEVWDAYRQMYYGGGSIGSVYLRDVDNAAFVGCFLIQKAVADERLSAGQWSSAHMVQVGKVKNGTSLYKIHSTVWVCMEPAEVKATSIGARLQKDSEATHKVGDNANACHLENVGKMIENIEIELRSNLDVIHIPKTREVVESVRKEPMLRGAGIPMMGMPLPKMGAGPMGAHAAMLSQAVLKRAEKPQS